jgi:hypothetical protein
LIATFAVMAQVVGEVDDGHAAAPDLALDAVPIGDRGAEGGGVGHGGNMGGGGRAGRRVGEAQRRVVSRE